MSLYSLSHTLRRLGDPTKFPPFLPHIFPGCEKKPDEVSSRISFSRACGASGKWEARRFLSARLFFSRCPRGGTLFAFFGILLLLLLNVHPPLCILIRSRAVVPQSPKRHKRPFVRVEGRKISLKKSVLPAAAADAAAVRSSPNRPISPVLGTYFFGLV